MPRRVAFVVDAYGLRLRLRLEGSEDEASDVWAYFLSDNVHQLGWGKKNKLRLNIPLGEFVCFHSKLMQTFSIEMQHC